MPVEIVGLAHQGRVVIVDGDAERTRNRLEIGFIKAGMWQVSPAIPKGDE